VNRQAVRTKAVVANGVHIPAEVSSDRDRSRWANKRVLQKKASLAATSIHPILVKHRHLESVEDPGDMNVFIVGGTGYIGRAVTRHILNAGHGVTAIV
jgi:hypothetical protein